MKTRQQHASSAAASRANRTHARTQKKFMETTRRCVIAANLALADARWIFEPIGADAGMTHNIDQKCSLEQWRRLVYATIITRTSRWLQSRSPAEYTVRLNMDFERPLSVLLVREWEDGRRMTDADFIEAALPDNLFRPSTIDAAFYERMNTVLGAVVTAAEATGWLLPDAINFDADERVASAKWNREPA